ncbi:MAG: endonuclease III [Clostridiales bacterium]|jgi:endonuclease-3|nr:endonuclease III [Clostridiales bacterium]
MPGENIDKIIIELKRLYPDAGCSLKYGTPLQLLISTQLAAQCTDARVNIVTPGLFLRYKDAKAFAEADINELEDYIRSTGFFHNKAKNIKNCCKKIIDNFDGKVPNTMEELLTLDGVGRKTANLVLGDAFGQPSVVVDTHAGRISRRLGLTKNMDPEKVETDLRNILPRDESSDFCHRLVMHGRAVCRSRKAQCDKCTLSNLCDKNFSFEVK